MESSLFHVLKHEKNLISLFEQKANEMFMKNSKQEKGKNEETIFKMKKFLCKEKKLINFKRMKKYLRFRLFRCLEENVRKLIGSSVLKKSKKKQRY